MSSEFAGIRNYQERAVFDAVRTWRGHYPLISDDLLPDVACVALNRLPARYIRHEVDLVFYQSEKERLMAERLVASAVGFAFEFVQARTAMRARA